MGIYEPQKVQSLGIKNTSLFLAVEFWCKSKLPIYLLIRLKGGVIIYILLSHAVLPLSIKNN